jgi:hypothetical protein
VSAQAGANSSHLHPKTEAAQRAAAAAVAAAAAAAAAAGGTNPPQFCSLSQPSPPPTSLVQSLLKVGN